PPWSFTALNNHFDEYVDTVLEHADQPLPGFVPQTTYWLIVAEQYAGTIDIRHHLTSALQKFGGHIGYQIRPSMRQKGYGTLQLKLCLPIVWQMGIERVLITCDDDNIGSQKIIEANGGVLQDKVDNGRASLTRRYWVEKPIA
ncbi:MAG: GNAT family N-acetyltransferase, partial [Chloroflexota bacterium]